MLGMLSGMEGGKGSSNGMRANTNQQLGQIQYMALPQRGNGLQGRLLGNRGSRMWSKGRRRSSGALAQL